MSNGIISNTLPAIISMGVVSRAVDTTMGRRRPKYAPRRKLQPKSKLWRHMVFKGPRGGRYIVRKGRRVYI